MIENPQTGLMKDQIEMWGIPYMDIDYCKYGVPYRKRTRLWNNVFNWIPRPLCKRDCNSMNGNKHIATAQRGASGKDPASWAGQPTFTQKQLYRVPPELIHDILVNCV